MQDTPVDELETSIAELGNSLVALEKFRTVPADVGALRRRAIDLGDDARRLHRRGRLDVDAARALLVSVHGLGDTLAALLAERRTSALYREAVAAHAQSDAVLRRLVPELFAGIVAIEPPTALYHAFSWYRRGRPLSPDDLARSAATLRHDGLAADGDPIARGRDPELPAVPLEEAPEPSAPASARWTGADLPPLVFRLVETGDVLVHVSRLAAPFEVLVPLTIVGDEAEDFLPDYPPYRDALRLALETVGLPVRG